MGIIIDEHSCPLATYPSAIPGDSVLLMTLSDGVPASGYDLACGDLQPLPRLEFHVPCGLT
jgi:hypothetical protein